MTDDSKPTNRLAGESSPYLLLHRHNPVDWYPWGEEALARAREEDRPIFLSVGYSTCYWCHVMERESFSNRDIAEQLNREFVSIKLDREERPELDEIYMTATQLLAGQGGWPNSVFLTPELKPYFAGTYFPPEDRGGRPGFARVLASMAEAFKTRRRDVEEQAESVAAAMRSYLEERSAAGDRLPGGDLMARSLADLERRFDPAWGGFGGAPKFPTPSNLYLLAELAPENARAAEMLRVTLDRMARGGLYDQLGGGFHRYSTDGEWKVPHFEKMLYDNGFLLELFARQARLDGDPEMARVATEVAAWLAREMTSPGGGLLSAQDAETDGEEGAFYVWTRDELRETLKEEDFGFLAPIYGFDGPPFFEGSHYVLHLPQPLERQAERRRLGRDELLRQIEPLRARLLAARERRRRPLVDDKILADWNGVAVAGLAAAGRLLQAPELVRQAARAADLVLTALRPRGGVLLHSWREGRGKIAAFLSDYAFVIRGLLELHAATSEERWLTAAAELAAEQEKRLGDPRGGFFTAAEAPDVLFRSKDAFDGAMPAANSVALLNLLALAERRGERVWLDSAERGLRFFSPLVERHPEAARMMSLAASRFHARAAGAASQVAGASGAVAEEADRIVRTAASLGAPDAEGWRELRVELRLAAGWHLYAHGADPALGRPTRLEAETAELDRIVYPEPVEVVLAPDAPPLAVYEGTVEIRARIRPDRGAPPRVRLTCQPCSDRRCLTPVTREIELPAFA